MYRLDLRRLILLLTIAATLLTLLNSFHASYRTLHRQLIAQTLEANRAYAAKLAHSTDNFLKAAQQQLAYSAALLPELFDRPERLDAEVTRLKGQTGTFNGVFIVRTDGRVLATAPNSLGLVGGVLKTREMLAALSARQPRISAPYAGVRGYLLVFLSQPVFARDGRYLGYVGGAIHLGKHDGSLQALLGNHYYQDGSQLYVVDANRHLLHHQDPSRIGEVVTGNPAVEAVLRGEEGSRQLLDSQRTDMLAGYAPVASTGWGVVAQRPSAATLAALDGLMLEILFDALLFFVPLLVAIWWLSKLIARPLRQLAITARHWEFSTAQEQIRRVHSWYFEAEQLKLAMLGGLALLHGKLGRLNQENITDPLTGLVNRRGQQFALERWQEQQQPFAVIVLDIDHFKQVNDNHGHDVGDQVLQHVSHLMDSVSRSSDLVCRSGGEEFVLLLPETGLEAATQVAERLRGLISHTQTPTGSFVTISTGVAHWPGSASSVPAVLKLADEALYRAKRNGRNRVVVAGQREIGSEDAPLG
ncbi:sensor domain-containing diguanylate cyclase [Azotobacter vinelandii]|uniref:sensor domain-containing diguanylate cyclase n=1 Tax=Azotobacter vinelandii TaxID=354 RepID=UPI000774BCC2|nr:sensor domain-containing diguanylate cyclase [Azotobacter vinelandii]WKN22090.1 sensor domain-containing diguanylate cyclase [Azotobacter vinelandii]SFX29878.1 diguanylate cyclase (GGDEF) domain-containing protein [Azotobacter vinelandii]